ncbi:hypothetical protein [Streptomyces sp. LKA04]|uniref:hypothetical protein n=1 Tax=Streptomyces sp. LKA04 TaxID=3398092 RepID=UPI003A802B92
MGSHTKPSQSKEDPADRSSFQAGRWLSPVNRGHPGRLQRRDHTGQPEIISVAGALPHGDPELRTTKGDKVGLMLFPGNDDVASPDVSWSHTGFSMFRKRLAQAEGFTLTEMNAFGGKRQWRSVSTTLAPPLNHPDNDGPDLTPAQCAAMLPRLEAILDQQQSDDSDPVIRRRIEDARQLITVLQFCVDKDVKLIFG